MKKIKSRCIICGKVLKNSESVNCLNCEGWNKNLTPREIEFKLRANGLGQMPEPEINR